MVKRVGDVDNCAVCERAYVRTNNKQKYCSARCNKFAYDNRKRVKKKIEKNNLNLFEHQDLETIRKLSREAGETVDIVIAVAGADVARYVIAGMWDLMARNNLVGGDGGKSP